MADPETTQAFDPDVIDKIYSLDSFNGLVQEWEGYVRGSIYDSETGNFYSKEQYRRRQLAKKAQELGDSLADRITGDERSPEKLEKVLLDIAKEGYLARHPGANADEQNLKNYITDIAQQASQGKIASFEGALAEILSAKSPYNPLEEGDSSIVLNALYSTIATDTNKEASEIRRLENSLADEPFTKYWHAMYRNSIWELDWREGVKAAKPMFKENATGAEIMHAVKELYTTGQVDNLAVPYIQFTPPSNA